MAKYEQLNRQTHDRLRFGPTRDYRFAAELTLVPIILDEIAMVAREYPIIFPGDTDLPHALTGMRPQTNAHVDADGKWRANYIPLKIRQHPFGLSEVPGADQDGGKKHFVLCINTEAEELRDLEGARVFDSNGDLGPEASAKGELARKLLERTGVTRALVQVLEAAGLLVERSIKMKLFNDDLRTVQGFKVVDETRLNQMSDAEFVALRNKGALPLAYAQLMSMANLHQGILAGQVAPQVSEQDAAAPKKEGVDLDLYVDDSGEINLFH